MRRLSSRRRYKKRDRWLTASTASLKCGRELKPPPPRFHCFLRREPIAKRQAEGLGFDLEYVAFLRLHPVAERQGGGAEKMDVHVARAAEQAIFEMVRLEIGDRMGHVLFA